MDQFDPRLAAQKFAMMEQLAAQQAAGMRDPSLRRNTVPGMGSPANTGAQVPAHMGAQGGYDPNPYAQVPGGGSTANALPLPNQLVDDRQSYDQLANDALINALLGYGIAGGSMMAGPNPLTAVGAIGGGLYGLANNAVSGYAADKAKRLGYQGN